MSAALVSVLEGSSAWCVALALVIFGLQALVRAAAVLDRERSKSYVRRKMADKIDQAGPLDAGTTVQILNALMEHGGATESPSSDDDAADKSVQPEEPPPQPDQ